MKSNVNDESNKKNWMILVVAILLAAGAAWLSGLYLDNKEQEIRSSLTGNEVVKVPVVVPRFTLKPGDVVSDSNMVVREIPEKYVPDGAFTPSEFKSLIGRTVTASISGGKPLLENSVAGVGIEQFSDLLESGHRAITLSMDQFNSNAGMLVAGDKIDLFLMANKNSIVGKKEEKNSSSALYLILENAVVLATGKTTVEEELITQHFDENKIGYNTITLGVPLRDAGRIGLARKEGDFIAMLRNRKDQKRVKYRYLDSKDLYQNIESVDRNVEYIIGGSSSNGIASVKQQATEFKELAKKIAQLEKTNHSVN